MPDEIITDDVLNNQDSYTGHAFACAFLHDGDAIVIFNYVCETVGDDSKTEYIRHIARWNPIDGYKWNFYFADSKKYNIDSFVAEISQSLPASKLKYDNMPIGYGRPNRYVHAYEGNTYGEMFVSYENLYERYDAKTRFTACEAWVDEGALLDGGEWMLFRRSYIFAQLILIYLSYDSFNDIQSIIPDAVERYNTAYNTLINNNIINYKFEEKMLNRLRDKLRGKSSNNTKDIAAAIMEIANQINIRVAAVRFTSSPSHVVPDNVCYLNTDMFDASKILLYDSVPMPSSIQQTRSISFIKNSDNHSDEFYISFALVTSELNVYNGIVDTETLSDAIIAILRNTYIDFTLSEDIILNTGEQITMLFDDNSPTYVASTMFINSQELAMNIESVKGAINAQLDCIYSQSMIFTLSVHDTDIRLDYAKLNKTVINKDNCNLISWLAAYPVNHCGYDPEEIQSLTINMQIAFRANGPQISELDIQGGSFIYDSSKTCTNISITWQ